ncbi:MAG: hypothetical protein IT340_19595 [Chloroflexi bacterium]|nr:hypothetical protein [Chloroflexota bacterium]
MSDKDEARYEPAADTVTPLERDYLLRSAINSLALAGVSVTDAEASRILDEVLLEPLPDIG